MEAVQARAELRHPRGPAGHALQRAGVVRNVDGKLSEHRQRHQLQDRFMGGRQDDRRRYGVVVGAGPVHCRDAPAVTGYQSREAVLRPWSGQVVADAALVVEELAGDHRADRVATWVLRAGTARAVAKEPGDRVDAARLQIATEHVALCHRPIMPGGRPLFRTGHARRCRRGVGMEYFRRIAAVWLVRLPEPAERTTTSIARHVDAAPPTSSTGDAEAGGFQ